MLAATRPRMGMLLHTRRTISSSNPRPDPFDAASSSYPFPSPTAPAPGPAILDDSETKFLDSFFDGVSSDQFSYDFFSNPQDGSEVGMGWDELPPTFMGTTSSFGHQPPMGSHPLGDMGFNDMGAHINGAASIPSSAPSNVLLGNGSNSAVFQGSQTTLPADGLPRSHSMSHYPQRTNPALQERGEGNSDWMRAPFYTELVFENRVDEAGHPRQASMAHAKTDILWGSDSNFTSAQAFVPPNHERKQVAALELSHIKTVEEAFYETNKKLGSPGSLSSSPSLGNQRRNSIGHRNDDGPDSRPVKRRKSNFQAELGNDSPTSGSKHGLRKHKTLKEEGSTSPSSKSNQKRRKSSTGTAAAKPSRENLTEEQKRENHIKSEQKRRTLIREGFEDLNNLVPGLRGGGFSKSAVLIMSADWLENLLQGNEVLQQRLDSMQNR